MHTLVTRTLTATALSGLVLVGLGASPAGADPAVELPDAACNHGTAIAYDKASQSSNSPVWPHGNHGCHVHLPK